MAMNSWGPCTCHACTCEGCKVCDPPEPPDEDAEDLTPVVSGEPLPDPWADKLGGAA